MRKPFVIGLSLAVLAATGMVLIARADAATVPAYHPTRLAPGA
ncbi:MAG TPA: hypothetical protein VFH03_21225 [Actinoplanes sp.]|nr:hypothetical protein [Actinoplanes sp.]